MKVLVGRLRMMDKHRPTRNLQRIPYNILIPAGPTPTGRSWFRAARGRSATPGRTRHRARSWVGDDAAFTAGAWDVVTADGLFIEFDEELPCGHYRGRTLRVPWTGRIPWSGAYRPTAPALKRIACGPAMARMVRELIRHGTDGRWVRAERLLPGRGVLEVGTTRAVRRGEGRLSPVCPGYPVGTGVRRRPHR